MRALVVGIVLLGTLARADEPVPPVEEEKKDDKDEGKKGKKDKKDKKSKGMAGEVEVSGRLFARHTITSGDGGSLGGFDVDSARVAVEYRLGDKLRAVVEAEFAKNTLLRDAFARYRPTERLEIRAGQFKEAALALRQESQWRLPSTERGVVDDVVTGRFQVGGRRPGVQAAWEPIDRLELRLGLAQGDSLGTLDEELGERALGNVLVNLRGIEISGWGEIRSVRSVVGMPVEWFWASGLDVVVDKRVGPGRLRAWLELTVGAHPFDANAADDDEAVYTAATGVIGYHLGGADDGKPYAEVFATGGGLDPDADIGSDLVVELGGGVVVGLWDRARLQLEVTRQEIAANAPIDLGEDGLPLVDETTVVMQAGVAFK